MWFPRYQPPSISCLKSGDVICHLSKKIFFLNFEIETCGFQATEYVEKLRKSKIFVILLFLMLKTEFYYFY